MEVLFNHQHNEEIIFSPKLLALQYAKQHALYHEHAHCTFIEYRV